MTQGTRICQNCKNEFQIAPEDFDFYEKIGVPPPTWCPTCRMKRRMMFLNERTLHKRTCDLCKKETLSLFPVDADRPVYCPKCWWSDNWDPLQYGKEYDFSKPFFEQLEELLKKVPDFGPQTMHTTMVNSEYCNIASYLKNCYLLFNSDYSEDCGYSTCLERSKNCFDLYMCDLCELCYDSRNLFKCSNVLFSSDCHECVNVLFSKNLRGCTDCFGCVNLRNKQYHIFNQPYSKEEYRKAIQKFDISSHKTVEELKQRTTELAKKLPKRCMEGTHNATVSGNYISNSKNTFSSYQVTDTEDCKFCQFLFIPSSKDCYDVTMWGGGATRIYECMGAGGGQNNFKFCFDTWTEALNVEYSWNILARNSNLFGCVSLRNKDYCILNKQYTREEYDLLIPKIKRHMDEMPYTDPQGRTYRYGEFFPPKLAAFPYNESFAQKIFPLRKSEAEAQGYRWRDPNVRNYGVTKENAEIPDSIREVSDDILEDVIQCEHKGTCDEQCATAFKLTIPELSFYRRLNVPLPRLCPNCRHYQKFREATNLDLSKRACACAGPESKDKTYKNTAKHFHEVAHCPNEFETSYALGQNEIVYCENCYNSEVA